MRIENNGTQKVVASYAVQMNNMITKNKKEVEERDSVIISEEGQILQKANEKLKGIPDIRQDKVDTIREALKSGKYLIDSKEIAAKIIDRRV